MVPKKAFHSQTPIGNNRKHNFKNYCSQSVFMGMFNTTKYRINDVLNVENTKTQNFSK